MAGDGGWREPAARIRARRRARLARLGMLAAAVILVAAATAAFLVPMLVTP